MELRPYDYVLFDFPEKHLSADMDSTYKVLKKLDLDFELVDFRGLASSYRQISGDISRCWKPGSAIPAASREKALVEIHRDLPMQLIEGLTGLSASFSSFDQFAHAAGPIVEQRGDAALSKTFENLVKLGSERQGRDVEILDYYAMFLPSAKDIRSTSPRLVQSILESVIEFFRKVAAYLRDRVVDLIAVIRCADETYLRLRGEVHELQRVHPELGFLSVLLFLPDLFRLFVRLLFDRRVSLAVKKGVGLALLYLVVPIDLLPEGLIGPVGYTEDVLIMLRALARMMTDNSVSRGLIEEHWSGGERTLDGLLEAARFLETNIAYFQEVIGWFQQQAWAGA
ncbi:MAG: DUF1232 domain-containing protein [Deltaproteobacteria bacterium]|nr:DUF1232 domain-containing protein [Deltaproteobacteria bacterium]